MSKAQLGCADPEWASARANAPGEDEAAVSEEACRRKKEVSNPTPFRGALCFRGKPGSQPVFLPRGVARATSSRWSVRESNPLRRAFQTPALPIELTDHDSDTIRTRRKAEDSNLTRTRRANRVPGDLRASRICLPRRNDVRSGRQDSNLRSPAPQAGAFAGLSYALRRQAIPAMLAAAASAAAEDEPRSPRERRGGTDDRWSSFASWTRTRESRRELAAGGAVTAPRSTRSSPSNERRAPQAESGADAAQPSQYGCQTSGSSPSSRRSGGTTGRDAGFFGCRSSFMPACSGVRLPLRSLHA